jgi:DNA-binding helix-hairpin-helix protein with protein kinase domain
MDLPSGTRLVGASGTTYVVQSRVGSGGQGVVYRATEGDGGADVALKVYLDTWLGHDPLVMNRVRELIEERHSENLGLVEFVWPQDTIADTKLKAFTMSFVPQNYVPLRAMVDDETGDYEYAIERLPLRIVTKIGAALADAFDRLHGAGIAYRDLNGGNVFVDPKTGAIAILDTEQSVANDDSKVNIAGVESYRAPELWQYGFYPNSETDAYSLAVLFFKMLVIGHPLDGALEVQSRGPDGLSIDDEDARRRRYGTEPLFIFHPSDASNAPVPGFHDYPIRLWPALPASMRELFIRTFTTGLRSPERRVLENEWLPAFLRLRASIVSCSLATCGVENFFDPSEPQNRCSGCGAVLERRWLLESEGATIVLEPGLAVTRSYLDWEAARAADDRLALVVARDMPDGARLIGLKNVGVAPWLARRGDSPEAEPERIAPGKTLQLGSFSHVAFEPDGPFARLIAPEQRVPS